MSTPRTHLFQYVHHTLRAMLYDTGKYIQRTNLSQPHQSDRALEKLERVIAAFEGHAALEDNIIFPHIRDLAPHLVADFEGQRLAGTQLCHALTNMIAGCRKAVTHQERLLCWIRLLHDLNEFIAFHLEHMNKEEARIGPVFQDHFSDDEIRGIMAKINGSIRPGKSEPVVQWTMRWAQAAANIAGADHQDEERGCRDWEEAHRGLLVA